MEVKKFSELPLNEYFVYRGFVYKKTDMNKGFNTRHGFFYINPNEEIETFPKEKAVSLLTKFIEFIKGLI